MERRIVRRSRSKLASRSGAVLFRRAWLPRDPARALLIVHGMAEHGGRYDAVGAWLAAHRCAVHTYDQRGHGLSSGPRGDFDSFEHLLDDLEDVLDAVRREHPDLPLVLLGHSMGGLVAASLLCERKPDLQAVIISGAPLAAPDHLPAWRVALVRGLRRVAPRLRTGTAVEPETLSRDPAVVRAYLEDELVFRRVTLRFAAELLAAMARTAEAASRVAVPMLLLHGEADRLVSARSSRQFHARLHGSGHRLRVYPRLRHEILNEPERDQVLEDILAWLGEREA